MTLALVIFKNWFKERLVQGRIFTQIIRSAKLPVTATKYFPYKYGEDSYYIPKQLDASIKLCPIKLCPNGLEPRWGVKLFISMARVKPAVISAT